MSRADTEAEIMVRWFFFLVVSAVLMVAAPRAAGAGLEVTGFGGVQVIGGHDTGPTGMLRIHVPAGPSMTLGIDAGYAAMAGGADAIIVYPAIEGYGLGPPYSGSATNHLTWVAGSFKARAAPRGDAQAYFGMMIGVSDHITRGPGFLPLETVHHGRFHMASAFGVESHDRLGPAMEFRAFATGLDHGGAVGVSVSVGLRFAPWPGPFVNGSMDPRATVPPAASPPTAAPGSRPAAPSGSRRRAANRAPSSTRESTR